MIDTQVIDIQLLSSLDEMHEIQPQWHQLCQQAQSPNAFFDPCFLLPALRHIPSRSVSLLCVWSNAARETLLALMPLQQRRTHYQLPLAHTTLWRHAYCYLCTPLVAESLSGQQLQAVLQKLVNQQRVPPCFVFGWIDTSSPLLNPGSHATARQWCFHRDPLLTRAGLHLTGTYEGFLASLRTKKRKDLLRNRRRLAEIGVYQVSVISGDSSSAKHQACLGEFIELENRGWKQEQGTSIASDPMHEQYFRCSVLGGLEKHQVLVVRLSLDDQPVAMLVVLLSACGRAGYTQKIAINTQFERYSPGSLVILELTDYVFNSALHINSLDSCAAPIHPMIDALWRDRISLGNVVITDRHSWRNPLVSLVNAARKLKRSNAL